MGISDEIKVVTIIIDEVTIYLRHLSDNTLPFQSFLTSLVMHDSKETCQKVCCVHVQSFFLFLSPL